MTKINILKNKITGKREGDFNLRKGHYIKLILHYQTKPQFEKELLELLTKYFNIRNLNQQKNEHSKTITKSKF